MTSHVEFRPSGLRPATALIQSVIHARLGILPGTPGRATTTAAGLSALVTRMGGQLRLLRLLSLSSHLVLLLFHLWSVVQTHLLCSPVQDQHSLRTIGSRPARARTAMAAPVPSPRAPLSCTVATCSRQSSRHGIRLRPSSRLLAFSSQGWFLPSQSCAFLVVVALCRPLSGGI